MLTRRNFLKTGTFVAVPLLGGNIKNIVDPVAPAAKRLTILESLLKERCERREALVSKWNLQNFSVSYPYRQDVAQLLENQSQWNHGDYREPLPGLTLFAFQNQIINELFSFQALDKPTDFIYWREGKYRQSELKSDAIGASVIQLRATWNYEAIQDLRSVHGIDATAELRTILAHEVNLELFRVAVKDIRVGCEVTKCYTEQIDSIIEYELRSIHHNLGKDGEAFINWVITSPQNLQALLKVLGPNYESCWKENISSLEPRNVLQFKLNRRQPEQYCYVYLDPLLPAQEMLVGCKQWEGDYPIASVHTGYIFAPLYGLMFSPAYLDPTAFVPRQKVFIRAGRKLVNPNYYKRIINERIPNELEQT